MSQQHQPSEHHTSDSHTSDSHATGQPGAGVHGTPLDRWKTYIAVGDSFTEGLWDPYPYSDGRPAPAGTASTARQRGWADRLATTLSRRRVEAGLSPLNYANLAIRGRKMSDIAGSQLTAALEHGPDLVSIIGGGNDILRPGVDVESIADQLERAVITARQAGADVLMAAGFRASRELAFTRSATGQFNSFVWGIAQRHGAYVIDLWGMRSLADLRLWSDDRLHLTPESHQRVTSAALVALGLPPDDDAYDALLPPQDPAPTLADIAKADAQWAKDHAMPWMGRRIRRASSGDLLQAKWPQPAPWPRSAEPHLTGPDAERVDAAGACLAKSEPRPE